MGVRFDPAAFVRNLENAGVPGEQARAHLDVLRDTLMAGLASRQDIQTLIEDMDGVRGMLSEQKGHIDAAMDGLRADVEALRHDTDAKLAALTEALSRKRSGGGVGAWALTIIGAMAVLACGVAVGAWMGPADWVATLRPGAG